MIELTPEELRDLIVKSMEMSGTLPAEVTPDAIEMGAHGIQCLIVSMQLLG